MNICGVSCLHHDASVSLIRDNEILFAAHSERYSRVKNDPDLNHDLINDMMTYGDPDVVVFYENPWRKRFRQLYAGEKLDRNPTAYLRKFFPKTKITHGDHHRSHAMAGFSTSGFSDAAIIVADAIGEWTTLSIWDATSDRIQLVEKINYPNSLGLLYSGFTKRVGLKPNEHEYILMGMAAYGNPSLVEDIRRDFLNSDINIPKFELLSNVHTGIGDWKPEAKNEDLAASIQMVLEDYLSDLFSWTAYRTRRKNVVFMGGIALNCSANGKLLQMGDFDNYWIMPNPGDAGSSLGAAADYKFKKTLDPHLDWTTPYLGTSITQRIDPVRVVDVLLERGVYGLAHGRAEFGPRALGNRSILADPRTKVTKSRINQIKQREPFRPFGPVVLEELADDWFYMPVETLPYMQYTVRPKYPSRIPSAVHLDNTCRVQTVSSRQNPVLASILREWYNRTGVPVLVNTSMNVKGEPLVNTIEDAIRFSQINDVTIR